MEPRVDEGDPWEGGSWDKWMDEEGSWGERGGTIRWPGQEPDPYHTSELDRSSWKERAVDEVDTVSWSEGWTDEDLAVAFYLGMQKAQEEKMELVMHI